MTTASSTIRARTAEGAGASALEVRMPCPHKMFSMLNHQPLEMRYSCRANPRLACSRNGGEPELGGSVTPLDMHMHRLCPIARVEEEPVWPYSEDRRHRPSSSRLNSPPIAAR